MLCCAVNGWATSRLKDKIIELGEIQKGPVGLFSSDVKVQAKAIEQLMRDHDSAAARRAHVKLEFENAMSRVGLEAIRLEKLAKDLESQIKDAERQGKREELAELKAEQQRNGIDLARSVGEKKKAEAAHDLLIESESASSVERERLRALEKKKKEKL